MASIVTITFSPCIDKSTSVPVLLSEKKLHCAAPKLEPGGGGINAARAIKKLGGDTLAVFPSGGYTGKFFNQLLQDEGIASLIIESKNETRENFVVFEETTGRQYRFGMPGTALSEEEWKKCLKAVEYIPRTAYIVASGSLPPGVPLNIYAQLAAIAKTKNAKFIVDTSGDALKHAVDEGVYLLKPNLNELSFLAGEKIIQPKEVKAAAKTIINKGKCEVIVVSMGAAGAMLVTSNISTLITTPQVIIKSTVGAGDSMVGGIAFYLSAGKNISEAVRYGVACGTAATMNPATELCHKADADKLYEQMKAPLYEQEII
jgi:6-phosphofructokinase 2